MTKKNDAWTRLDRRVSKARKVVAAGLVKRVDKIAKMPSFSVDGRVFNTKLKRVGHSNVIVATCWGTDALGSGKCEGMVNHHICWHTLAAILAKGAQVKFYSTEVGARKSGLESWCVVSSQGKGKIWVAT